MRDGARSTVHAVMFLLLKLSCPRLFGEVFVFGLALWFLIVGVLDIAIGLDICALARTDTDIAFNSMLRRINIRTDGRV